MRNKTERLFKKMSNTAFDVAAAPMFIVAFGFPVLIFAVAVLIAVWAVSRIIRINKKNKEGSHKK